MIRIIQKIITLFLHREKNSDEISSYPNWRIGLSCATSWSWGISIAVGIAILFTKGLFPFYIWTIGNILAIPLFGFVRKYLPKSRGWLKFTPLFFLFVFVEYFAITLNLQAIRSALGGGIDISSYSFLPDNYIVPIVMFLGIFIVWFINKYGLKGSVLTDIGQYAIQLFGVILLALIGYCIGHVNEFLWVTPEGIDWILTGFLGIITGALGTGHQWQRFSSIDEKNIFSVSIWGGLFFALYMFFVYLAGLFFTQNLVLGLIFLLIILSVATSTIDSAVAGLQFIAKRFNIDPRIGSIVALLTVVAWPFVVQQGLTSIWTFMVSIRYPFVLALIVGTIVYTILPNEKTKLFLQKYHLMFKK